MSSEKPAGRTFKQRMAAVGVAAVVIMLFRLAGWLTGSAHSDVHPSGVRSQAELLPPGINFSGHQDPPNWGAVPNFPQAGRDR